MVTQISQRDVSAIVTRRLLHLALECLGDDLEGNSSLQEESRPVKRLKYATRPFDASMESTWSSGSASQRSRRSDHTDDYAPSQRRSLFAHSQRSDDTNAKVVVRQRVLAALNALDRSDRDSRMEGTIDRYITLQQSDPASYRKGAQFFQVLRSIRKAMENNKYRQVRSLYYDNVNLFEKSSEDVKEYLDGLARFWRVHPSAFNILSGCRGQYAGPIWIERDLRKEVDNDVYDGSSQFSSQAAFDGAECQSFPADKHILDYKPMIIEDPILIQRLQLGHKIPWVVVVEKETVFIERVQELATSRFKGDDNGGKGFGLLVTGRGYPDHTTRRFLLHLRDFLPATTPFYTLMDGDAYGMQISQSFHVPDHHNDRSSKPLQETLQWIGLRPSQWRRYLAILQMKCIVALPFFEDDDIPTEANYNFESCVSLDAPEYQRAFSMLRRDDIPRALQRELCKLIQLGFKLELEAAKHIPLHALLP